MSDHDDRHPIRPFCSGRRGQRLTLAGMLQHLEHREPIVMSDIERLGLPQHLVARNGWSNFGTWISTFRPSSPERSPPAVTA